MSEFCIYGVSAIIKRTVNGKMCILLQERYKGENSSETGLLETPCGKVKITESAFDVIRKKVFVETGIKVTNINGESDVSLFKINGYKVIEFKPFFTSQNLENNYSLLMDFFICEAEGEHCSNSPEAKNIRWIPLDIVKNMLNNRPEVFYPMIIGALKAFCKEQNEIEFQKVNT